MMEANAMMETEIEKYERKIQYPKNHRNAPSSSSGDLACLVALIS